MTLGQFANKLSGILPVSPLQPLNVPLNIVASVQLVNKLSGMLPVSPPQVENV